LREALLPHAARLSNALLGRPGGSLDGHGGGSRGRSGRRRGCGRRRARKEAAQREGNLDIARKRPEECRPHSCRADWLKQTIPSRRHGSNAGGAMTIRIPKWLLIVVAVIVGAGAAFLIGRSTGGDSPPTQSSTSVSNQSVHQLRCNSSVAKRVATKG